MRWLLAAIALLSLLSLASAQPPNCTWEVLTLPSCPMACTADCLALNCSVSCMTSTCTATPNCEANCTDAVYDNSTCPTCVPVCQTLPCEVDCEIICQPLNCSWGCVFPRNAACGYPTFELSCPPIACESIGDRFSLLLVLFGLLTL